MSLKPTIEKIVSGGQTGVDRGALDAALYLGVPCGGWCPKGRRAEDGPIPLEYPLLETESASYPERTERNVVESDATLILSIDQPTGGTKLTVDLAKKHAKPYLALELQSELAMDEACQWVAEQEIAVLNVAGPRESGCPGIQRQAQAFTDRLLQRCAK